MYQHRRAAARYVTRYPTPLNVAARRGSRPLKGSRLTELDGPGGITVLCCRTEGESMPALAYGDDAVRAGARSGRRTRVATDAGGAKAGTADAAGIGAILAACGGYPTHIVGRRPKKEVDPLLAGRVLVVGDDSDLNAVVLRLLRKDLLGAVEVAYATPHPTAFTDIYALPTGPEAVRAATRAEVDRVPLVRSDAGGVLLGAAQLAPVTGTFYVDEQRIPGGSAKVIEVEPDARSGVAVTVVRKRILGFGRQPATYRGRAVEFGLLPGSGTAIWYDGIRHPREVNRWVFYQHTQPLRLVRGVY